MVKNTIGGKKGKMMAKKRTTNHDVQFPVSTDENEIYVCVTKIYGGGVFEVVDNEKTKYKAFLRGKMRGSNKRHNLVSMHSILLAGIRIDSSDKSMVDILFVYDTHQIQTLSLIPSLNINYIILLHSGAGTIFDNNNTIFSNFISDSESDSIIQTQTQIHNTDTDTDHLDPHFDFDFDFDFKDI